MDVKPVYRKGWRKNIYKRSGITVWCRKLYLFPKMDPKITVKFFKKQSTIGAGHSVPELPDLPKIQVQPAGNIIKILPKRRQNGKQNKPSGFKRKNKICPKNRNIKRGILP